MLKKKAPAPHCPSCMKPIGSCGCAMRGNKKIQRGN